MNARFSEDFKPGEIYDLGKYTVSRNEITDFAKKYDPFPFHIDDDAAAETVFGGIISSGWLTSLIWLRLMHQNFLTYETILGSPGHEEVKWPNPVRPDDELQGNVEISGNCISKSRADIGFVTYRATLLNQNGDTVFNTTDTLIVKPRP